MFKEMQSKKQSLCDDWLIDTDYNDEGTNNRYYEKPTQSAKKTHVPSIIQEVFPDYTGTVWYWKTFKCELKPGCSDRLFIKFGAVDYKAFVWLNGIYAGEYEGGESEFEFDVTDMVSDSEENLLAMRVINVCDRTIDGLNITNTPNRNKSIELRSGCSIDVGGVLGNVELLMREAAAITDLFPSSDIHTGKVNIELQVTNYKAPIGSAELKISIIDDKGEGVPVAGLSDTVMLKSGKNTLGYTLTIPQPVLWDLDNPYLYYIKCELETEFGVSVYGVKHGLREFLVQDGYFRLNGKRIFLKCSHSGNCQPIGIEYPAVKDFMRRDFINAKAAGFNMIRVCAFLFRPEQLDFCDEIGLLIMDECFAAWKIAVEEHPENPCPLGEEEAYLERFDRNTSQMIYQDRNHTSVVIYELLNETENTNVFRRAVDFLPKARKIDRSRLILLNSGRFDCVLSIGCVSNPYSDKWENVWGADSKTVIPGTNEIGPSVIGSGDIHLYPLIPHTEEVYDHFAALGTGMRPVFLSEYGVGTQFNVIHEARMFEQYGADPNLLDYRWVKRQSDDLKRDFSNFGFDKVFPFAETMLEESQRLGARQRSLGFNLIRANPNICGFSMTGLFDHGMCGEGLWSYWRRWKPEMFDAICDGFSPLRFCLMTYPTNVYSDLPFRIKASLATEDALRPGVYSSSYKIIGDNGIVWEKEEDIVIPEDMPLAVQVFDEKITLSVPTGKYTLYANLNNGGSPTGGKLVFYITNKNDIKDHPGARIYTWGVDKKAVDFMKLHGVQCEEFSGQTNVPVMVGYPKDFSDEKKWDMLRCNAEAGGIVLYMQAKLFSEHPDLASHSGFEGGFKCSYNVDHLYHKEIVALPHKIFDGIRTGMFDLDYVGTLFPHEVLETDSSPEIICSSFVTGYLWVDGSYKSFYSIMKGKCGKGNIIINTPYVLENIGSNPVSDVMLMNYIGYIS